MLRWLPAAPLLAALAIGCANGDQRDPCERALDRLVNECGFEIDGYEDLEINCSGQAACVSMCLQNSPCTSIASQTAEFASCVDGCQ